MPTPESDSSSILVRAKSLAYGWRRRGFIMCWVQFDLRLIGDAPDAAPHSTMALRLL
jgi:hypothetical protein